MRVPQAADAAVIKSFNVNPGIVQFYVPASHAIPGSFWKRKILSGRLADPARPGEVNVSFTLAQRFHLRAGDSLPLVLSSAAGRPVPFVFHVAGIDAAQIEFPPQPGNGTYIVDRGFGAGCGAGEECPRSACSHTSDLGKPS
jgi:hypothetical protein